MADVSIANLPAFVGAGVAANDFGVMVDVDDTSESPLGTTKRFTFAQVTNNIPGSVIIGGDLTVVGTGHLGALTVVGSSTFGGAVIANAGVIINGPVAAFQPGAIYTNGTLGLVVAGVTGASYDFSIVTPGGGIVMSVPTGTGNAVFSAAVHVAGALSVAGASSLAFVGATDIAVASTLVSPLVQTGRIAPVADGAGVQWTNNAQTVEWMRLFASGLTVNGMIAVPNGKYFQAQRADGAPINVLGFDAGTNTLRTVLAGDWVIRDTGAVALVTIGVDGVIRNNGIATGFAMGSIAGVQRIQWDAGSLSFAFLTAANGSANLIASNGAFSTVNASQITLPNNGYVLGRTFGGVAVVLMGVTTADKLLIDNSSLGVLMGGNCTVAGGVIVTAGGLVINSGGLVVVAHGANITGGLTLPGYGGGGGAVGSGTADSGGVGFRVLRVPN